jgi:hypothetical protein
MAAATDSNIYLLSIDLNPESDSKALHCVYERRVTITELHGLSLFAVILYILWQNLSVVMFLQFMKKLVFFAYQLSPMETTSQISVNTCLAG